MWNRTKNTNKTNKQKRANASAKCNRLDMYSIQYKEYDITYKENDTVWIKRRKTEISGHEILQRSQLSSRKTSNGNGSTQIRWNKKYVPRSAVSATLPKYEKNFLPSQP